MIQYLELLQQIKERGTLKPAAREGMPSTLSLFGYQFRHNLQDGFPLLTTKKMAWKSVVTELLWFLRGDTNIKYLVDNGCNIWNEDAYNYFLKISNQNNMGASKESVPFEMFVDIVKNNTKEQLYGIWRMPDYIIGDCGFQYGRVWRGWEGIDKEAFLNSDALSDEELNHGIFYKTIEIDQIANVIKSLKETPESRRHIVTAIDPTHDTDLALYWCHAMFQFNCRPLTIDQRFKLWFDGKKPNRWVVDEFDEWSEDLQSKSLDESNIPRYYLDCQLYQRSADVVLGVPFNIASYALLIHIVAKIVGMIPGEFIHTFGDVHIYENHMDAVEEQLKREPRELPKLRMNEYLNWEEIGFNFNLLIPADFSISNYNPHPKIEAKLSTGLQNKRT